MPEGPSLVILREKLQPFAGRIVQRVDGAANIDLQRLHRRRIAAIRTWGKHLLIVFSDVSVRIHLLMFGTYCIDERKDGKRPMLRLGFSGDSEINFYTCSVRFIEGDLDDTYDWRGDVLSETWSPRIARRKLLASPERPVCDVLLDQDIFAGVGNIIRNEVLFRIRVHPECAVGALTPRQLGALIREARNYSEDFLAWKRDFVLKRNLLVHTRKTCPACGSALVKFHPGQSARRSFYCPHCQPACVKSVTHKTRKRKPAA